MKLILNIAGAIAILATGCVKADVIEQCVNQATTAHALVHARNVGTPKENLINYINTKEEPQHRAMLHRILDEAYGNRKLSEQAAYDNEMTFCMAFRSVN